MKMAKSLLLGSAAGLVAVAGAQAADLPVKAKPVEYVKVCSLYGAGYYFMPGSDICIKVGGYVRYQATANPGQSISAGPFSGAGSFNTRTNEVQVGQRTRAVVTVDTRQQTAYGTLRTYMLLGFQQDSTIAGTTGGGNASPTNPGGILYATRGFLQIAGFTFGKATSFFDIYPGASFAYNAGFVYTPDTGDAGAIVAAYTAQLGGGFSLTVSAEQSRKANITIPGTFAFGAAPPANNATGITGTVGTSPYPDLVANLRLDQAWGSVLVSGAIKDASGGYFTGGPAPFFANQRPESEIGFAVSGGFILNLPMIGAGDRLSAQAVYSEGAVRYAAVTPSGNGQFLGRFSEGTAGGGFLSDAVFTNPVAGVAGTGQTSLTTAFSVAGAFEHFWTPALRTSVYGSYIDVSYDANGRNAICFGAGGATGGLFGQPGGVFGTPGTCNPDFQAYNIGSRTQWEPVRGLIMGIDVIYSKIESARTSTGNATFAPFAPNAGAANSVIVPVRDQDTFTGTFRIQRDFLP